jgi:hypothetical protein
LLPAALAERLAVRSDTVAERLDSGDSCAARAEAEALQAETIAALNQGRIPQRFQEELLGSVTALVESIEVCVAPAPEEETDDEEDEDDGEGRGKGKDKKQGKDKD